jgi:predicted short-subunit dehydrogenase-like oxidoreductase (DUF2520 family)
MNSFVSYALVGSGRVARHLAHYLELLHLPFATWSRQESPEALAQLVQRSSHVLLAISDPAIEPVAQQLGTDAKVLVHFSGALQSTLVHGAHPLMTFTPELQTQAWYQSISLVLDEGFTLNDLLPGLPNAWCNIPLAKKPLYHALCSLAGNSSFLLWQEIGARFAELGLKPELLAPFLHQVVEAATHSNGAAGFTGPVARGDWQTVSRHLQALDQQALENSYRSYLHLARQVGHPIPEELL